MVGACPYPVPQGSQVFLRDTAQLLESRGHTVHLVVYGYGGGEDTSGLRVHRARHVPLARRTAAGPSIFKPLLDTFLVLELRRVVREERIDAVWAHNYEALLVALAVGHRPIVYMAHNALEDELPHYFRGARLAARIGRWLDRTLPRRADAVVAPHARLAEYLTGCGCDRPIVIPPAAASQYQSPPFKGGLKKPDPEMAQGAPFVLYAGNLDAYQNLPLLYAAIWRVRQTLPNTRLVIATADRATIPDAEVIHTPDFPSLQRLLAQDCVLAVPRTSWSGYPIKLLNGMAAGRPTVACAGAAHPLTHEGNALIVPDGDEEAFAEALLRLLGDAPLRGRLGEAARMAAAQNHARELIADQLEEVLLRVGCMRDACATIGP